MVRKGDSIEDVMKYVGCRIDHLKLEMGKVPYVIEKESIQKALNKLHARIQELERMKKVLNGDIKSASKFEWRKVEYLKKRKDEMNRKKEEEKNNV